MTLILTALAAIIATIIVFAQPQVSDKFHVGALALMYWGASIMWVVDGFACLAEGEPFVELSDAAAMADDALLGVCVIVLGLAAWFVVLLVKGRAKTQTA
ncbi:hypothetical protein [Curtanaerobium respiraculi]|uniref:hypothetical protein n=1 Tax=Curtanaerobium respiraculi TaxID=2949669 RepID=UPI0024B38CC9|nr:hypothetical protein [Curtanaerobium respiraculi]